MYINQRCTDTKIFADTDTRFFADTDTDTDTDTRFFADTDTDTDTDTFVCPSLFMELDHADLLLRKSLATS